MLLLCHFEVSVDVFWHGGLPFDLKGSQACGAPADSPSHTIWMLLWTHFSESILGYEAPPQDKNNKLTTRCNCLKRTLGWHCAAPWMNYPKAFNQSHYKGSRRTRGGEWRWLQPRVQRERRATLNSCTYFSYESHPSSFDWVQICFENGVWAAS